MFVGCIVNAGCQCLSRSLAARLNLICICTVYLLKYFLSEQNDDDSGDGDENHKLG